MHTHTEILEGPVRYERIDMCGNKFVKCVMNIIIEMTSLKVGLRLICQCNFKNNRSQFWRE